MPPTKKPLVKTSHLMEDRLDNYRRFGNYDLETTLWELRLGNYQSLLQQLRFPDLETMIPKLQKSPIWKPNLRDLITKNLRFGIYVLGTEIPRFGNYHSSIW